MSDEKPAIKVANEKRTWAKVIGGAILAVVVGTIAVITGSSSKGSGST